MSKRKHEEQSEKGEMEEDGAAKRGRSTGAHDVSEAAADAATSSAAAAHSAAAAPSAASAAAADADADPYAAEVALIRRTHLRHIHTESLMSRMLGGGQTTLRQRVDAYAEEMKGDVKRTESLLDVNYQDAEGRTLLMHVIQLFGALCAQRHHPVAGSVPLPLSALDVGGVKDHLESLLRGADLTLRDRKGLDSLNFLAHNIVVNAQCYTDWFVVTQLCSMAAARGLLDSRDPDGCTPFLHWCGSGPTPNVLQLLIAHGCDIDATDSNGNTGLHRLVQSRNFRALEALAKDQPGFLCRDWFARNRAGLNALELSAVVMLGHHSADSSRVKVHRLLQCAWRDWQQCIAPLLQRQLERVMQLADLAKMTLEYLDGSGRPFTQPPQPKSPAKPVAETASAVQQPSVPGAAHPHPAAAAPPVVALDAADPEVAAEPAAAAAAGVAAAAAAAVAVAGVNPAAAAIVIDDAEEENDADDGEGVGEEDEEPWIGDVDEEQLEEFEELLDAPSGSDGDE